MNGGQLVVPETGDLVNNPFTGEAIDLSADSETLARAVQDLRDLDGERRELVKVINRELIKRMDANASWTMHFTGIDVTSSAPGKWDYNGEKLKAVLEQLVTDGLITKDAALNAIDRTVTYKAKKRGVDALMKLGGEIERSLKAVRARIPDESRSVSVKVKENVVDAS